MRMNGKSAELKEEKSKIICQQHTNSVLDLSIRLYRAIRFFPKVSDFLIFPYAFFDQKHSQSFIGKLTNSHSEFPNIIR